MLFCLADIDDRLSRLCSIIDMQQSEREWNTSTYVDIYTYTGTIKNYALSAKSSQGTFPVYESFINCFPLRDI